MPVILYFDSKCAILHNAVFFDHFNRYFGYLPFASDTAGSPPRVPRRRRRRGGFRNRSSGGSLRGEVSASQPSKLIPFRVLCNETSLLPKQLHCQNVRGHHDNHGDVEGNQRTEYEERSVVDHACSWPRHNVRRIYYT